MKPQFVEARDIPDAWFQLVDLCFSKGRDYKVTEGSYANCQVRRELDYTTVHIKYPWYTPLLPDIPPGLGIPNPVPEGMKYINQYIPYLMTDEKKPGEQYTYGSRLMGKLFCNGSDKQKDIASDMACQVDEVIAKFKRGYGNNQACMTIAQPSDIHLSDPPCLRQIDCRIYDAGITDRDTAPADFGVTDTQQLHFIIYFRSWDLWGGFPANLAALVHLQEYMASSIGVGPGEFICSSKGLHLYDMYWELAERRLGIK